MATKRVVMVAPHTESATKEGIRNPRTSQMLLNTSQIKRNPTAIPVMLRILRLKALKLSHSARRAGIPEHITRGTLKNSREYMMSATREPARK